MSRVWLITGSNRGLGRAFAQAAVRHGDKVIAGTRTINPDDTMPDMASAEHLRRFRTRAFASCSRQIISVW